TAFLGHRPYLSTPLQVTSPAGHPLGGDQRGVSKNALKRHAGAAGDAAHLLDQFRSLALIDRDLGSPFRPQRFFRERDRRGLQQPAKKLVGVGTDAVALTLAVGGAELSG